ncbi:MAG: TonB family protein [Candidatus Omnitrophota bacterium]
MRTDHLLRYTLVASFLVHGMIVFQSPRFNPFSPVPKAQKMEVRYVKDNPETRILPKNQFKLDMQKRISKQDHFLKLDSKIINARSIPPPYVEEGKRSKALPESFSELPKPSFAAPDLMIIKKKITLPPIEMARIDNPSYISYYQIVREKIRRSVYQSYSQNQTGEVYVSFIISNDGYIKGVRLIEDKTTASDYLKNIALKSVKDASPFPNFPKELDYPQLSFNIIISFEIEN